MIDVRELRIGNYAKLGERVERVYQIIYDRTSGYSGKYSINHKDYNEEFFEPIELTEDIIEKCGFKKDDFITREFNKKGDYNFRAINHYENGFLIICNFMQGGIMTKHLHQLQNLFYCLTGKELEITL